jgi:hypothetical protein
MAIYESGVRDEDELAAMAANRELNFMAGRGHFQKPFPFKNAAASTHQSMTEH